MANLEQEALQKKIMDAFQADLDKMSEEEIADMIMRGEHPITPTLQRLAREAQKT